MRHLIVILILLLSLNKASAHVAHHKGLENLTFDIYRNGQYAGFHTIDFKWQKDGSLEVKNIIDDLEVINTTLLLSQGKSWILNNNSKKLVDVFSCKNHSDVISEFLFLISNLYLYRFFHNVD